MTMTLVVDQGRRAHRIVSWRRAVCMFLEGKVEVIAEYDEEVYRSATVIIKMPAVVRLLQKLGKKRNNRFSRINVATRDDFRCQYCNARQPLRRLTYDHVVPRSQGGTTCWENIVMACRPCNGRKRNRTPEQAGMLLRVKPVKPKSLSVTAFHFDRSDGLPDVIATWLYWHGQLEEG